MQIWDIYGQEIYRSLIIIFYRNASLAMMVYAIEYKESFTHIETWLKEDALSCEALMNASISYDLLLSD